LKTNSPRWKPTSKRRHAGRGDIDFALLVDGLAAEREQGITIDVAYRFFATEKRKFIVADTPGHEQYTRNMVTGASTADLAVILIDARKGVLTQTRRHSYLAHLLGIRHLVLAVNKMDLVGYDRAVFDRIVTDYRAFAESIGIADVTPIPLSGLAGDNITTASSGAMPWYDGPVLLEHLETVSNWIKPPIRAKPVPHAGAMGQPPQSGFPRLCGHDHIGQRLRWATICAFCPRARPERSRAL
jgi:bifunctional enzyme CysN/CysC